MKLLYIAGPYRASCGVKTMKNIHRAESFGKRVLLNLNDWFPVIPHMNTALWDFDKNLRDVTDDVYLSGTMEIMRRCDAVLAFGDSEGTRAEIAEAEKIGIPVYRSIEDVKG